MPLAAAIDGASGPVLMLGNSLGTSRALWNRQVPALARRFRVLRFELPGHGGAAAEPGPYSIDDLGASAVAVLDSLGIERAAYCGVSLGGMIGMWIASRHPDRITALGLICTSAWLPPASAWLARAGAVRSGGMAPVVDQVVARWFTPAYAARAPGVRAAFADGLGRTDPEGYAACCEAIAGLDLRPRLASITAPTLVIAGSEDPATPPAHGAAIAAAIPRARLAVVRGAAHLANVSAAAEVTAALLGLLTGADGARR